MELLAMPFFIKFRLLDAIDIILVAFLIYQAYKLMRGTVAIRIFFGIVAIFVIAKVVELLHMELLSEILGQFISVGIIAAIILFQKELRKFLNILGTRTTEFGKNNIIFNKKNKKDGPDNRKINMFTNVLSSFSKQKLGALIVFERANKLGEFSTTGTIIDAKISEELLENIFFKNSPLHDGAIILNEYRIYSAGCILPVSSSEELPSHFGLRHRAAIGLTEETDAICITVSEETGNISICENGKISEHKEVDNEVIKQLEVVFSR